jgi:hypothetical protein
MVPHAALQYKFGPAIQPCITDSDAICACRVTVADHGR